MRTTETNANETLNWWGRLHRDVVFLVGLIKMIGYYWTVGQRIRKAYVECESRGEVYQVDEKSAETGRAIQ